MNVRVLLLAPLFASCAVDADEPAPFTTLAATQEVTAKLGVTTWDVTRLDEGVRVVGLDPAMNRNVEMIVQRDARTPDDRVHVDVVFPEAATFDLTSSGDLEGALSDSAKLFGDAAQSDLAHHTTP